MTNSWQHLIATPKSVLYFFGLGPELSTLTLGDGEFPYIYFRKGSLKIVYDNTPLKRALFPDEHYIGKL